MFFACSYANTNFQILIRISAISERERERERERDFDPGKLTFTLLIWLYQA